ncbi:MAG TPA: sugar phosphate isomerase/epimerase family protein [Acidisarcina sp.]
MKIGVSAFAWTKDFNQSHLALLPKINEQGLAAFEIPMFEPRFDSGKLSASEIRRAFEANDVECTVCAILPGGINPISADPSVRKRSLAHLMQCVETSAELGAHLLGGPLYSPIGYLPGRRRNHDEWTWALEAFNALVETLEANDITLSIEPVNRSETFFLTTAAEAKALCGALDHRRIGVTIDTFHANIEEKNIVDAIRDLGPRLKHLHASENDRGLLGSGHMDFPAILAALHDIEYDGCLMIEGFGYSPGEPGSLGALWGDLEVSPEDIAFKGATYLRSLNI